MKKIILAFFFFAAVAVNASELNTKAETTVDGVEITASVYPPEGFMKNSWGQIRYRMDNKSDKVAKLIKVEHTWSFAGEKSNDSWTTNLNVVASPGKTGKTEKYQYLPGSIADKGEASSNGFSTILNVLTYSIGDEVKTFDYALDVDVATIDEPFEEHEGQYVTLNFTKKAFEGIDNLPEILACMDNVYLAMMELTGYRPFDAKKIEYRECPRHSAWAFAGNPINLNRLYVRDSLVSYSRGEINFGWTHELGHDFDNGGINSWYRISSQYAEYQANIKLAYAWSKLAVDGSDFLVTLWSRTGQRSGLPKVTGTQFVNSFFYGFGEDYLLSDRKWESMLSDEFFDFHIRMIRTYGWELLENWYKAMHALMNKGLERPASNEDKLNLSCAIFSEISGKDQVKYFQKWRFPVTEEGVKAAKENYPVAEV